MFVTTFCFNLLKFNGDEDTDIEALLAFVNFCSLVMYLDLDKKMTGKHEPIQLRGIQIRPMAN